MGVSNNDRLWQGFWDFVFVFANFLLAILFGAAAGNLPRGVPLDAHGNFSMAFFTDFERSIPAFFNLAVVYSWR